MSHLSNKRLLEMKQASDFMFNEIKESYFKLPKVGEEGYDPILAKQADIMFASMLCDHTITLDKIKKEQAIRKPIKRRIIKPKTLEAKLQNSK